MNFATAKMSTTVKDKKAENPLIDHAAAPVRSWCVRWCLTMPEPAMVKPVNTPMA